MKTLRSDKFVHMRITAEGHKALIDYLRIKGMRQADFLGQLVMWFIEQPRPIRAAILERVPMMGMAEVCQGAEEVLDDAGNMAGDARKADQQDKKGRHRRKDGGKK